MRSENVCCPVCGLVNLELDLEETNGSFECIFCGSLCLCHSDMEMDDKGRFRRVLYTEEYLAV